MTTFLTAIFAAVSAAIYIPVFALLSAAVGTRVRGRTYAAIGALLGPCLWLLIAWRLGEFAGGPAANSTPLYWGRYAATSLIGGLPFVVSGAVLGLAWERHTVQRPPLWPNIVGAILLLGCTVGFGIGFFGKELATTLVPSRFVVAMLGILAAGFFAGGGVVAVARRIVNRPAV